MDVGSSKPILGNELLAMLIPTYKRFKWRGSLIARLYCLAGILLLLVAMNIATTFWGTSVQRFDSLVINLMGRQRMLIQRFSSEVFREVNSPSSRNHLPMGDNSSRGAGWQRASQETRTLFETTAAALRYGGTTHIDLQMDQTVTVPATTNPQIQSKLATVDDLWKQLQQVVSSVQVAAESGSDNFTAYHEQLDRFLPLKMACLKEMDATVRIYQADAEAKVAMLTKIQYVAGAIAILMLTAFFRLVPGITERKQMEEALRKSEERYRELVEKTDDLVMRVDGDGRFIYVNHAAGTVFGVKAEECVGLSAFDFVHPEDRTRTKEWFDKCVRERVSGATIENRQVSRTGESRQMLWTCNFHFDDSGKVVAVNSIARNITDRKRAEESLRESERRFRASLIESPFPTMLHAEDGEVIAISNVWTELTGYTHEEIPTLSAWTQRAYGEKMHAVKSRIDKVFDVNSRVDEGEYYITAKGGSLLTWHFSSSPSGKLPDGRRVVISAAIDVTERKRAEEEVTNLSKFPSENPHPVLRVAADGTVLYANAAAEPPLGSRESAVGKILPDEWNEVNTDALAANSTRQTDVEHLGKTFSFEVVPVSGAEYVNWYGRDITERKQAEEERRKLEEKMQQAQKLESLGMMAGGIAHDFNNLLMGVLSVADQASHEVPSTSAVHQHFEMIRKSARRAAALCQQMLAYSGKGRFTVQAFSLDKLVEDMMELLEVSVSKGVVLKRNYAKKVPTVEADVNQIRQVVMNLIINASEAIGDGSGVVSVSTGVMEADKDYLSTAYLDDDLGEGSYVYVEVADTGCGMDRETIGKIFDPFFTTKFTGRGLGLAAVLGIVRGHRGTLKVESRPGQGTTIRVLLPASGKKAKPLDVKPPKAGQRQGDGTVLLIDDEEILREAVKLLFSSSGFKLLTAQDGREGVEVFRHHADEIVVVLLDMTMPRMSGKETFQQLRQIQPDVKVILISGYAEEEAKNRFEAEGLVGFLQKPFVRAELMAILEEAIHVS